MDYCFFFLFSLCVCTSWLHERTNHGSNVAVRGHLWRLFSSSIFVWLSGIKLILPGLSSKNLPPPSHLIGPWLVLRDFKSSTYNLPFECKQDSRNLTFALLKCFYISLFFWAPSNLSWSAFPELYVQVFQINSLHSLAQWRHGLASFFRLFSPASGSPSLLSCLLITLVLPSWPWDASSLCGVRVPGLFFVVIAWLIFFVFFSLLALFKTQYTFITQNISAFILDWSLQLISKFLHFLKKHKNHIFKYTKLNKTKSAFLNIRSDKQTA